MTKHLLLGELNASTLAIVRMTVVVSDAEGWFTTEDVSKPIRGVTAEGAVRELYKVLLQYELMDEMVDATGTKRYQLTKRGAALLSAVLNS